MRFSICTLAVILLSSTSLSGCTGSNLGTTMDSNSYAYGNSQAYGNSHQGYNQYNANCFMGAQAALTQPVYMSNAPECLGANNAYPVAASGLRGSSPAYYNTYDQGTMLRGSAPYGRAVNNNAAYYHTARPEKNSGGYVSIGGVAYDVGDSLYGIQGRAGYNFNQNFGVEAEASIGLIDQNVLDVSAGAVSVSEDIGVNSSFGAFAVARVPVSKSFSLLARGGYHVTNLGVSGELIENGIVTDSFSENFKYDGVAYGVGMELATGPRNALRLDYTRYQLVSGLDGGTTNTVSASFVHKF